MYLSTPAIKRLHSSFPKGGWSSLRDGGFEQPPAHRNASAPFVKGNKSLGLRPLHFPPEADPSFGGRKGRVRGVESYFERSSNSKRHIFCRHNSHTKHNARISLISTLFVHSCEL